MLSLFACFISSAPVRAPPQHALELAPVSEVVEVSPGTTCLDEARVIEQLTTWLGSDSISADLRLHVEGDSALSRRARFTLWRSGELLVQREFAEGPESCADFHTVIGLAAAIAIDARVAQSLGLEPFAEPKVPASETERAPQEAPEKPDEAGEAGEPRLEAESAVEEGGDRRGVSARLFVGSDLAVKVLPRVALGARLGFELSPHDGLDLQMSGRMVRSFAHSLEPLEGSVDVLLASFGLQACGGNPNDRVRVRVCAGVVGGPFVAQGRGFAAASSETVGWLAAELGGKLGVQFNAVAGVELGVNAVLPIVNPTISVGLGNDAQMLAGPPVGVSVFVGPTFAL